MGQKKRKAKTSQGLRTSSQKVRLSEVSKILLGKGMLDSVKIAGLNGPRSREE